MNYISELAYASHIAQATKSAKDKRQKNKYQQSELLTCELVDETETNTSMLVDPINTTAWQGEERRDGINRRETSLNRGRYLEFRSTKDRRDNTKLSLKI